MMGDITGNYLGIDWGESKVGLALAHVETGVAVAYTTLQNSEKLLVQIQKIVEVESVTGLVVGIPEYHSDQKKSKPGQFGEDLSKITNLPVYFTNEMFTTKIAQQTLSLRGEKHPSKADDAESARILLQDWLDSQAEIISQGSMLQ